MSTAIRVSISLLFSALSGLGAQYAGSVRAADQFVPGAAVTARLGNQKIVAFTDENGRFSMDLPAGEWDIEVEMFEFTVAKEHVNVGAAPVRKDWTLEMPRVG